MTDEDPRDPRDPDGWSLTHPHHPLVDDDTAVVVEEATVELTLRRSLMGLGDGLADLHAMVSMLAQLQAWLPLVVASARSQGRSWIEIAGQLEVTPATARRRHKAYVAGCDAAPAGVPPVT